MSATGRKQTFVHPSFAVDGLKGVLGMWQRPLDLGATLLAGGKSVGAAPVGLQKSYTNQNDRPPGSREALSTIPSFTGTYCSRSAVSLSLVIGERIYWRMVRVSPSRSTSAIMPGPIGIGRPFGSSSAFSDVRTRTT